MLITREQVNHAMALTPFEVAAALRAGGYTDSKFSAAEYKGFNGVDFVYTVTFFDENTGRDDDGRVYVRFSRVKDGEPSILIGEF